MGPRSFPAFLSICLSAFLFNNQASAQNTTTKPPITFTLFAGESSGDESFISSSAIVAADFNHDGKLDIAVSLPTPGSDVGGVAVSLGLPDGSTDQLYNVGPFPDEILTADFNHDGNLDLAVANSRGNTVSILLGNGDGTFRPASDVILAGSPKAVTAADFTRDGFADLAVLDCIPNANCSLKIFRGNAAGDLTSWQKIGLPGPPDMAKGLMTSVDFNRDGRPDLALVTGNTEAMVFVDNATGHLQLRSQFKMPNGSVAGGMTWGSFNHDNLPDLAFRVVDACGASCGFANSIYVFLNTGSGGFVLRDRIRVHPGAGGSLLVATDIDGDNVQDLATVSEDSSNSELQYSLGNGNGKFNSPVNIFRLPFDPDNPSDDSQVIPGGLIARDANFDSRHDLGVAVMELGTEHGGWQILANGNAQTNCAPPNSSHLAARICSPAANATVPSTLTVKAAGNSPAGVKRMELWVDGRKRFEEWNDQLRTTVLLAPGRHRIVVEAVDQNDSFAPKLIFVTVP